MKLNFLKIPLQLPLVQEKSSVLIFLSVHPNTKKSRIIKIDEKAIYIDIKAAPKSGEANCALLDFFSNLFSLPLSSFVLKKGHSSHKKVLLVKNILVSDILALLR